MVWESVVKALFSDTNLMEIATYVNFKNERKQVFVRSEKPDVIIDSVLLAPTLVIHVLKADCGEIRSGESFIVAGKEYKVQGEPKLDAQNLIFKVDLV